MIRMYPLFSVFHFMFPMAVGFLGTLVSAVAPGLIRWGADRLFGGGGASGVQGYPAVLDEQRRQANYDFDRKRMMDQAFDPIRMSMLGNIGQFMQNQPIYSPTQYLSNLRSPQEYGRRTIGADPYAPPQAQGIQAGEYSFNNPFQERQDTATPPYNPSNVQSADFRDISGDGLPDSRRGLQAQSDYADSAYGYSSADRLNLPNVVTPEFAESVSRSMQGLFSVPGMDRISAQGGFNPMTGGGVIPEHIRNLPNTADPNMDRISAQERNRISAQVRNGRTSPRGEQFLSGETGRPDADAAERDAMRVVTPVDGRRGRDVDLGSQFDRGFSRTGRSSLPPITNRQNPFQTGSVNPSYGGSQGFGFSPYRSAGDMAFFKERINNQMMNPTRMPQGLMNRRMRSAMGTNRDATRARNMMMNRQIPSGFFNKG